MGVTVAMTGASGNMGVETLKQVLELSLVDKVKVLLVNERRERKDKRKWKKLYGDRVEIMFGNIAVFDDCKKLVEGSDYVLHLAAVIPPKADHFAEETDECNRVGTINIVNAISEMKRQPKLVHISTVAIYGNRNYKHPWGRIGDPLLPSAYDEYATTKIKGESFEPKQKTMSFFYCPSLGAVIFADSDSIVSELNAQFKNGIDAKGNALSTSTVWINLTTDTANDKAPATRAAAGGGN